MRHSQLCTIARLRQIGRVFVRPGNVDEVTLVEPPLCFGAGRHRLGHEGFDAGVVACLDLRAIEVAAVSVDLQRLLADRVSRAASAILLSCARSLPTLVTSCAVLCNEVVEALGQQVNLTSLRSFDESLHATARTVALLQFRRSESFHTASAMRRRRRP